MRLDIDTATDLETLAAAYDKPITALVKIAVSDYLTGRSEEPETQKALEDYQVRFTKSVQRLRSPETS